MIKRALGILVCVHAASAWSEETLGEADYFAEQPVVLSAARMSQPVNRAPAAVTVITREMIEASGFRHLVDVLRLVPGFVVGWSGGNLPTAAYLGLSDAFPHWMQIMVDGRSVYNPAYGHTTWRGIPLTLDDVERIEVVRGPNAANDGLNSMLGTVHIYTRHAAMTHGGMVDAVVGTRGSREANVRYGTEAGNGSWRLGLVGREDERHGVAKDHASDVQLSVRGDIQPSVRDELLVQMGASKGFWRGSNVGFLTDEGQHAYFLGGYGNLKWTRTLSGGASWWVQAHHTFNQNDEALSLPAPLDPLNANYRTTASSIQFTYLDQWSPMWRGNLAAEYRLNRVRLPTLLDSDAYLDDDVLRLSVATEGTLSAHWVVHAGATLERHSALDDSYLSPRVAINWLPDRLHAFRFGVSQGVSALGLYANNTDISLTIGGALYDQLYLSQNQLDPERVTSTELGYLFSQPDRALDLDLRIFHNRISDIGGATTVAFVDAEGNPLDVDGAVRTYDNRYQATQRGLEYQLRWQPELRSWLVLSQSFVSGESDSASYVHSVPRRTLSLLATRVLAGADVSLGYYRIGDMIWIGGDSDRKSKYNRLDLRLARDWKTHSGTISAALVIQSLLGKEFESFADDLYAHQYFSRRGYLSLKYEFR